MSWVCKDCIKRYKGCDFMTNNDCYVSKYKYKSERLIKKLAKKRAE